MVGKPRHFAAPRGLALLAVSVLASFPLGALTAARTTSLVPAPILTARRLSVAEAPPLLANRWTDDEWGLAIDPPAWWQRAPRESLNPVTQPADPVFEVVRFQLRLGGPSLSGGQPVAPTSGLLNNAGAILSIGVARTGSALIGATPVRWQETSHPLKGFVAIDEDSTGDGLRSFTRYYFAKSTGRVVVVRFFAGEDEWPAVGATFLASLATFAADPAKANGPEAMVPPPPPAPVFDAAVADPSLAIRGEILSRAASMLNIPFAWGGNSTKAGMDCSAWLSRVWGVERNSTDSIWNVSHVISKEQLLPGDAVNLTTGRDPKHLGHIRLFEAWANPAHTVMWVYEETDPHSMHRAVVYDDRYQPIRLSGLSGAGLALIVPGTPEPERTTTPKSAAKATPRPTPKPTPRPTVRPTIQVAPRPTATPRPAIWGSTTPRPTPTATQTPR